MAERIKAEQIARAAAQGVAIALSARSVSGDLDDLGTLGPIVMGNFPEELFEVTLERDAASGEISVKSLRPQKYAGRS